MPLLLKPASDPEAERQLGPSPALMDALAAEIGRTPARARPALVARIASLLEAATAADLQPPAWPELYWPLLFGDPET